MGERPEEVAAERAVRPEEAPALAAPHRGHASGRIQRLVEPGVPDPAALAVQDGGLAVPGSARQAAGGVRQGVVLLGQRASAPVHERPARPRLHAREPLSPGLGVVEARVDHPPPVPADEPVASRLRGDRETVHEAAGVAEARLDDPPALEVDPAALFVALRLHEPLRRGTDEPEGRREELGSVVADEAPRPAPHDRGRAVLPGILEGAPDDRGRDALLERLDVVVAGRHHGLAGPGDEPPAAVAEPAHARHAALEDRRVLDLEREGSSPRTIAIAPPHPRHPSPPWRGL